MLRATYLPPYKNEVDMIRMNYGSENLKEKVVEYSKKIYKKTKEVVVKEKESTICQRQIPFYVDTVRKFRDKRYDLKGMCKSLGKQIEKATSDGQPASKISMLRKELMVYESLQVAHKCILNSFYGYVMSKGARWFSMEMAAIVCYTGASIIRVAKECIDGIGISLELDTDGIWCLIPDTFPCTYIFKSGKRGNLLRSLLNYLVKEKFTNSQYYNGDVVVPQNSIEFEIDGPYKAMILPSSVEEGKLIKKR